MKFSHLHATLGFPFQISVSNHFAHHVLLFPGHSKYHVQNSVNIKSPTATRIVAQYQALPDPRQSGQNAAVDPFYSPILMKIDTIFAQLGIHDEPCKERLLCSMYKNPTQYSPHSNFISAELSRWDPDDGWTFRKR